MNQKIKKTSRKKFLLWGATLLSSFTVLKFATTNKPTAGKTVKMLSEDGTLVEIDMEKLIASKKSKISDEQLKSFVSKK